MPFTEFEKQIENRNSGVNYCSYDYRGRADCLDWGHSHGLKSCDYAQGTKEESFANISKVVLVREHDRVTEADCDRGHDEEGLMKEILDLLHQFPI